MKEFSAVVVAAALLTGAAQAQPADPNMNCQEFLEMAASMGPTPKTGDANIDKMAADVEAKLSAYCKANPKANAMEAVQKIVMGM